MTDGEMLPCPFCGGEAEMGQSYIPREHATRIICNACGVYVIRTDPWSKDGARVRAIAAWNTRALADRDEEYARPLPLKRHYPDYLDDPEGLERFRQSVLMNSGHDMAAVNHNSLGRLIDTIDRLRAERDRALADRQSDQRGGGVQRMRESALRDANDISARISAGGYRASISDVETLRNHVRKLAAAPRPAEQGGVEG